MVIFVPPLVTRPFNFFIHSVSAATCQFSIATVEFNCSLLLQAFSSLLYAFNFVSYASTFWFARCSIFAVFIFQSSDILCPYFGVHLQSPGILCPYYFIHFKIPGIICPYCGLLFQSFSMHLPLIVASFRLSVASLPFSSGIAKFLASYVLIVPCFAKFVAFICR